MNNHENQKPIIEDVKEEAGLEEDIEDDDNLNFEIKYQPKGAEREKRTGIKFEGDSGEFNQGIHKLK